MSDYHLVYIDAAREPHVDSAYDVYRIEGGPQLGTTERRGKLWTATDFTGEMKVGDTRWKTCAALWPAGGES